MKEFIKSLKKIFKQKKGFTLIELLVVIGILGILAAALVATIDPVEQLNKATDANVKNTVVEYITANIRYFTTHQAMPWADLNASAACQGTPAGTPPNGSALSPNAQMVSCTQALISDGELKASFATATNILKNINITGGANNAVIGCFIPVSKSQLKDDNTKYNITGTAYGTPKTTCKGYGGVTDCYWCTQ